MERLAEASGHRAHDPVLRRCLTGPNPRTNAQDHQTGRDHSPVPFVGDIHQPFHVGAEYFDAGGHAVDPEVEKSALADQGGNTFTLQLNDEPPRGRGVHKKKFHGFWDLAAVNALLPTLPDTMSKEERRRAMETAEKDLAHKLAAEEPKNWKLPSNVPLEEYAEAGADEILPIAREAHERLLFTHVAPLEEEDRVVAMGEVEVKNGLCSRGLSSMGGCYSPRRIAEGRMAIGGSAGKKPGPHGQVAATSSC